TKAPIAGQIPATKDILIGDQDRSPLAESFRLLRTNINFFLHGRKSQASKIFMTSTISGEGKTFVTLNLAKILAVSSRDVKVLVVEADLRNPKIAKYLELKTDRSMNGLTSYLM